MDLNKPLIQLAIPCIDINKTKDFYVNILDCKLDLEESDSLVLEMMGQQVVAQKMIDLSEEQYSITPRYFGLILSTKEEWQKYLNRFKKLNIRFVQKEKLRHIGQESEYFSFSIEDPNSNIIEFKYYTQSHLNYIYSLKHH